MTRALSSCRHTNQVTSELVLRLPDVVRDDCVHHAAPVECTLYRDLAGRDRDAQTINKAIDRVMGCDAKTVRCDRLVCVPF